MSENRSSMNACVFDGKLKRTTLPIPSRTHEEVLIKITRAGICNTDHEIVRGYVPGFNGIPGHEFIGIIESTDDHTLIGKRCTAEINCGCGSCDYCINDLERHCPSRTVIGIINRNGAFAEYISIPVKNIVQIPDAISDMRAVFIEPLAAALEILDQVSISDTSKVLLFGDGKQGILIAHVLASTGCDCTVVGMSPKKLELINYSNVKTVLLNDFSDDKYDVVIEATGNSSAFKRALHNVKPRGALVIKSTYAGGFEFNPSSIVVDEITMIGSRCGRFSTAVDFLLENDIPLENLISKEFKLENIIEAFEYSEKPDVLKVLLKME